jgi:hypothetical protein
MNRHYKTLGIAISINAVVMFFLTYAMIDTFGDFYFNINRVYMALMMAAPMVIVMLLLMGSMYENGKLNAVLIAVSAIVFLVCFSFARTQTPVGNVQFLRSMIPHHSSAILMCDNPRITDPEILDLCKSISRSQREEITQMQGILSRY